MMQSGQIIKYKNNTFTELPIEGVKISIDEVYLSVNLVLRANGDLFGYNRKTKEVNFVDSCVKDIDDNSYIKDHKWYFIDNNGIKLIMESDDPFIAVVSCADHIAAITEYNFYCVEIDNRDDYNCGFHGDFNIIKYPAKDKYIKLILNEYYMLQNSDGTVDEYNQHDDKYQTLPIPLVKDIFPGVVKLLDDSLLYVDYDFEPDDPVFITFPIKIYDSNLQQSVAYYGQPFLLINNKLYQLKTTASSINENYVPDQPAEYSLTLIRENVKNIFGSCGTQYLII